jgi:RHS repeat-associated protein
MTVDHYTGEYSGDYNELVYLRTRFYAPGIGHFLSRDTWGGDANEPMTFNKWAYVEGNPINFTDPAGQYSVSQLNYNLGSESFLYPDTDVLLFSTGVIDKSAFVALLLEASDYDTISIGYPRLNTENPFVSYSNYQMLLTLGDCKTILVGGKLLADFYRNDVKKLNQKWIFWRDTSVNYYKLSSRTEGKEYLFVGGNAMGMTDLPDFHSIDSSKVLSFLPDKKMLKVLRGYGQVSGIVDRYGNIYLGISIGLVPSINIVNYSEGYVCGYHCDGGILDRPSNLLESDLVRNMQGYCFSFTLQIGVGYSPELCNGTNGVIFSAGAAVSANVGVSYVVGPFGKVPSMGWDSFIEESRNGIIYDEVLRDIWTGKYP